MTQHDEDDPDPEKLWKNTRGGLTKKDWKEKIVAKKTGPRRHRQMSNSINAIDRIMATRSSKANEEAEEKKRARAREKKKRKDKIKMGREKKAEKPKTV